LVMPASRRAVTDPHNEATPRTCFRRGNQRLHDGDPVGRVERSGLGSVWIDGQVPLAHRGGKWAAKHGVWHYRTTVTAIASIAGMMLRCGE
jgi:hypothetical protein